MSLQDIQVKKIDLITETRPLDVELEIAVDVLCEGTVKVGICRNLLCLSFNSVRHGGRLVFGLLSSEGIPAGRIGEVMGLLIGMEDWISPWHSREPWFTTRTARRP